ncbi:MAG TPA: hypothetical protein VD932_03735 [Aquabacterium sp.]|nr:hypothetical protein [Aquabacterium sp.]
MLAAVLLFLSMVSPTEPAQPQDAWVFELVIRTAGQEWTMRMPVDEYLTCEELRDVWLTDGPRDTEDFSSESDCVQATEQHP